MRDELAELAEVVTVWLTSASLAKLRPFGRDCLTGLLAVDAPKKMRNKVRHDQKRYHFSERHGAAEYREIW